MPFTPSRSLREQGLPGRVLSGKDLDTHGSTPPTPREIREDNGRIPVYDGALRRSKPGQPSTTPTKS